MAAMDMAEAALIDKAFILLEHMPHDALERLAEPALARLLDVRCPEASEKDFHCL